MCRLPPIIASTGLWLLSSLCWRRAIFDRAEPTDVAVVLDEHALHRLIGSPAVMHDVLAHVAGMSQRPNIVVQVVPLSRGLMRG